MNREGEFHRVDNPTLVVWLAMTATGIAAWLTSGTPAVGALLIIALLLATVSPEGAVYATCAAIPLVFRPIEFGSLELGLLEIGILVSLVGLLFRSVFTLAEHRTPLRPTSTKLKTEWVLPTLLLLVGSLTLFWMPFDSHRAEALRSWRWVIVEPVILFVLARRAIASDGSGPLVLAMALPAGFVSLSAIWQLGWSGSSFSVDDVQRSTATYLHPNNLALYLERTLMLVLIPGLMLRSRMRWSFLFLSALIAIGVATTFSRGALLGLVVGLGVVLLAHPVLNGWKMLALGSLGVVSAFALVAGSRFTGAESSGFVETRRYLWGDSVTMLRDFPSTGIGLDQFLWLHQTRYIDPRIWSERYTSHPHNLLLDSWLSLGVAGLLLLLVFVVVGIWFIWQARTGRIRLSVWQLGALGCLGAGVGHGLVDNGYFLPDLAVIAWLAIALVIGSQPFGLPHDHVE